MIERAERPLWMEQATLFERAGKVLILTIVAILVIYPFITVVATSLSTQPEITRRGGLILLIPDEPSLSAYRTIFAGGIVTRAVLVVALVPILLVYPFLQRNFTGGVPSDALKC